MRRLGAPLSALLLHLLTFVGHSEGFVGVNYGTQFSAVVQPAQVVDLLRRQSIEHVRLYDADPGMMWALAGTGISVTVTVPSSEVPIVGSGSAAAAATWVAANVAAHVPAVNITAVCVGTDVAAATYPALLLAAMRRVHTALSASGLTRHVKVSAAFGPALISDPFPPSQARFVGPALLLLAPILAFLAETSSFFMLDVPSYDIYEAAGGAIGLGYALLEPSERSVVIDANTLHEYRCLFDAALDAGFFALEAANASSAAAALPIVVSATGWPSAGGPDATPGNAAAYYANVVAHVLAGGGTPARPGASVNTFLSELLSEDARPGPATGRSYGLFDASTLEPNFGLRLSGSGTLLANDSSSSSSSNDNLFCVASADADPALLQAALDWACASGRADCSALQPGRPCYRPDSVRSHASFAFDSFFQSSARSLASCDFGGLATISTTDPSTATCIFPGSANATSNASVADIATSANNSSSSAANMSIVYNGHAAAAAYTNRAAPFTPRQLDSQLLLLVLSSILARIFFRFVEV